jgi:4-diphosphocytidyl-2-C-methyl-D-erythritol kinase
MTVLTTQARAKINLCLFVGPIRTDGQHEVVTLMDSLTLCDDVRMDTAVPGLAADEVVCPGVSGPNLAAAALHAFRAATGWDGPPVRLEIDKRIPVAGGMAGGSADAAAALRLASEASGFCDRRQLEEIGSVLGADVASQIRGGLVLATGTGSRLRPLKMSLSYSVVVVPVDAELSAAQVYAEADRLGLSRDPLDLARSLTRTQAALSAETVLDCVHNDLQDAARSLCPAIDKALEGSLAAGADHALVSGSGPTVVALFVGAGHRERAHRVCDALVAEDRTPTPTLTRPAGPISFSRPFE